MFNRVRDGLVYPRELLRYRKDAMWKVILYIVFFAVLFSSGSIVETITYDGLSESYKENVRQNMTVVNEDCAIENSILVCDSEYTIQLYQDNMVFFYLDSHAELDLELYQESGYSIIFHQDSVYFAYKNRVAYTYLISDLDNSIHNLDFSDQTTSPVVFYNSLFTVVDSLLISSRAYWGTIIVFMEIMISFVVYMLFILLSAYFLRKRFAIVPFKHLFAMTTYASTGLFIILIFDSLLSFNLLLLFLLVVLAFRQNNLLASEIEKRLKNKS